MIIRILNYILPFLILYFCTIELFSQKTNIAFPLIESFERGQYEGGLQNWDIEFDKQGLIYIANNHGLLRFDGNKWTTHVTPKRTIMRSLYLDTLTQRLYAGGQGEFGYFESITNEPTWIDLSHLVSRENGFADVWEILMFKDIIYFRSDEHIFAYNGTNITHFPIGGTSSFLTLLDDKITANRKEEGLVTLEGERVKGLSSSSCLAGIEIVEILELKGEKLCFTRDNGILVFKGNSCVPWENEASRYLRKNKIQSAYIEMQSNTISIGTFLGGVVLLDGNGQLIHKIDRNNGLLSNTISALGSDQIGNIWVGSYKGINKICNSIGLRHLSPDENAEAALYDIIKWNDHIYFATANGLRRILDKKHYTLGKREYEFIAGSEGECWGLDIINGELFLAHHKGAFQILPNGQLNEIFTGPGAWRFLPLANSKILLGTYDGLYILKKENNAWELESKVNDFFESSRIINKVKDGQYLISHPYKGLFQFDFPMNDPASGSIKLIQSENGLPSLNNIYVHQLEDQVLVSGDQGIFSLDPITSKFTLDTVFMNAFDNNRLLRIIQGEKQHWYIAQQNLGIITKDDEGLQLQALLPNENTLVEGFENLYPIGQNEAFICSNTGVSHIFELNNSSKIKAINSTIYRYDRKDKLTHFINKDLEEVALPHTTQSITFEFSTGLSTGIGAKDEFQFMLDGYDETWSDWSQEKYTYYTNLDPGNYTFLLRAKNGNNLSEAQSFDFEIKTPWYKSFVMLVLYSGIAIGIVMGLIRLFNRRTIKEKEILETEKKQTEEEFEDLQKQYLEHQISTKNEELASLTMHLLQKNELIANVEQSISKTARYVKDSKASKELKGLLSILRDNQRTEEDWERFSRSFDQVHQDFIKRIKNSYDQLTANDLKLCAYLRMNLSTKEIAPLLGISVRGVEISRYRLRKKLDLKKEQNLNEFMIKF